MNSPKVILTIIVWSLLSGCVAAGKFASETEENTNQTVEVVEQPAYMAFQQDYRNRMSDSKQNGFGQTESTLDINYYVRGMMQELVANIQYVNSKTPMAVASFVFLDGSYEYSDIVGKQLAESFSHEIHKFGIPIVDFKATDYIRVTQNGDFVLSKDFLDLDSELPVRYTLTGTLVKQPTGYLVNVRIIGMESKAIVASAQGQLPTKVINSLISSQRNTGALFISSSEQN